MVLQFYAKKQCEAAPLSLDAYYSFPNITNENNNFTYSTFKGNNWKTITLDTGSYELVSISNEIQRQVIRDGNYNQKTKEFYIDIMANSSKLKFIIIISNKDR